MVMVAVMMPVVVIHHLIPATESLAEIGALIARTVRVAEIVMPIRIRWLVGIDIVAGGLDSVMEAAMPGP